MTERLATVFGGTGYLGRAVVHRLADAGWRVRVAVRHPEAAHAVRTGAPVEAVAADVRDDASVTAAVAGTAPPVSAVVNAVGLYVERGARTFDAIHAEGAARVARAARAAGVGRFVHVSGIGVLSSSPSRYVRARARGERRVREEFPEAMIVRPSVLFGPGDSFLNSLARISRLLPAVPLFGDGRTRLQPVYVDDVADAVARMLEAPGAPGKVFELGGGRVYSYRRIVEMVLAHQGRRRALVSVPFALWNALACTLSLLPAAPLTRDQVELMRHHNVAGTGVWTFADLGIRAAALEDLLGVSLERGP